MVDKQDGALSIADIAANLITSASPEEVSNEEDSSGDADQANDVQEQDENEDETEEEQAETEEQEAETEEPDDDSDDEVEEPNDPEADQTEDYLDINDDDIISVVVDGAEHDVTIADLKKAYSGEGAIEARIQEATEARNQTHSLNTQLIEKMALENVLMTTALENAGETLFAPLIPKPDDALKSSNPQQYLSHLDAYEQDQTRINAARNSIQKEMDAIKQAHQERLQQYAQEASLAVSKIIPELADPDTAKREAYFNRMATTAMNYGYSADEIAQALDPRMFTLVRDAMLYQDLTSRAKEKGTNVANLDGQKKKIRKLRSGNTRAKSKAARAQKQRTAVMEKARKTGKVADIAATLISG